MEKQYSKSVECSLQYIPGIGRTTAKQILVDLGMDNKFTKDLSEEELTSLREEVSKYMIEGDLVCFSFPFQLMPEGTFFFLLSVEGSIFLFSVFFSFWRGFRGPVKRILASLLA